ncbi:MAG: hypothetical protein WCC57_14845 [Paracoccaceae bacterium]
MQNRLRMLMGATALLYFGPLLAGLGNFGWAIVPVFAAIFVLWLVILRPQEWPRSMADWQRPEALVALAARGAVQLLLVAVCFGIGRGLGGVLGAMPPFPVMLPIAVSFLSIPLARLIWDPWKAAQIDTFAEGDLPPVENSNPIVGDTTPAHAMVDPLCNLPADVSEADLDAHLAAMAPHISHQALLEALVARASGDTASRSGQKALMIHATKPAVADVLQGAGAPTLAFQIAGQDDELLDLFARRCTDLIHQDADAWGDCPSSDLLRDAAASHPTAALATLADALDAAEPAAA